MFDFLSYQLITRNQPFTSSSFIQRILSSDLLWSFSGDSKTLYKVSGCLVKYLSFNHTYFKQKYMQYSKITRQNCTSVTMHSSLALNLCQSSGVHPWPWMLPKLSNAESSSPWTGQAEIPNPLKNCHSLDKEHQLTVWPVLPVENPAVSTSFLC